MDTSKRSYVLDSPSEAEIKRVLDEIELTDAVSSFSVEVEYDGSMFPEIAESDTDQPADSDPSRTTETSTDQSEETEPSVEEIETDDVDSISLSPGTQKWQLATVLFHAESNPKPRDITSALNGSSWEIPQGSAYHALSQLVELEVIERGDSSTYEISSRGERLLRDRCRGDSNAGLGVPDDVWTGMEQMDIVNSGPSAQQTQVASAD
ncbi:hypothetical protein [Halosegnis longus]|uniref:hypothetical protein n=1 Tax=Halosegnis longus TaxID=2216012 RepID=UPI00129E158F|nr:hypothetical protein [Halosegnis longus]